MVMTGGWLIFVLPGLYHTQATKTLHISQGIASKIVVEHGFHHPQMVAVRAVALPQYTIMSSGYGEGLYLEDHPT